MRVLSRLHTGPILGSTAFVRSMLDDTVDDINPELPILRTIP